MKKLTLTLRTNWMEGINIEVVKVMIKKHTPDRAKTLEVTKGGNGIRTQ